MKTKLLFSLLCILPMASNAAVIYRAEQVNMPIDEYADGHDSEALAKIKRFYVGGAYNFAIWNDATDDNNTAVTGRTSSSFEAMLGIRAYDIFRVEANYIRTNAKYDALQLTGDTVMINAIFDARIDNEYRLFRKQSLVPYVGLGAGISWNSTDDAIIENKISPAMAALAGVGIELGEWFALDFGYRYFYMFSPNFDAFPGIAPSANQFRVGARVHF